MTEGRRLHVGAYVGVCAAAYGLSLAVVTAMQAQSDAAVAADRAPTQNAIAGLSAGHDRLDDEGRRTADSYNRTTASYERITADLTGVEANLARLAKTVGSVEGAARSLPDHVALPRVVRAATTTVPTIVHATTGGTGH